MIALLELKPYAGDIVAPSPNRGARRAPAIRGIVLHATADAGDEARSLSWLRSRQSRASCHLLVGRDGRVTRLVGDRHRAWHAGHSRWRGTSDVNSITLGIEIANRNDGEPYTRAQYRRVADVVAHYCRQGLSLDDVVSHGEIAAGRKTDPRGWDWDRFRAMVRYRLRKAKEKRPPAAPAPAPERREVRPPDVPALSPPAPAPPAPPRLRVPVITMPKPARHSRTLWLNGMTALAAGGVLAGDALDLGLRVGLTLPEELTEWALFGVGLLTIVLRLRTRQPVTCGESATDRLAPPRWSARTSAGRDDPIA